ncbi:DUF4422 domain-containing protein [Serratia fonticola]|uniref:DUF4422 domain-containing protein n=1 Tax=Serratia fonticola TaxID=47917 RepID=UPI00301E0ECB
MKTAIAIVTHKEYIFPNDEGYKPIVVGGGYREHGFSVDSVGDNISHLNQSFCELTALYWLWKNDDSSIIGLSHYRRYFTDKENFLLLNGRKVSTSESLVTKLKEYDLIVASPRDYHITNIKNHYIKAHSITDFNLLRSEVQQQYPEYIPAFDSVMSKRKLSLYNMFIGHRAIVTEYLSWMFSILFELEKKIPYQSYDAYQKRVFGFMSERLFNVWLEHHKDKLKISYCNVVNIEGENLFKKAYGLIKRHYF